jgi:hypothetical protein
MMIETLLRFAAFLTERDRTKWYTFNVFDICLFLISGASYLVSGLESSPAVLWIMIIIMNAIETFYHNKNSSKTED